MPPPIDLFLYFLLHDLLFQLYLTQLWIVTKNFALPSQWFDFISKFFPYPLPQIRPQFSSYLLLITSNNPYLYCFHFVIRVWMKNFKAHRTISFLKHIWYLSRSSSLEISDPNLHCDTVEGWYYLYSLYIYCWTYFFQTYNICAKE